MPATASQGAIIRRWNSSSGSWEDLAEVQSISGPTMSRTTIDTTTLATTGGYMTFIGGLRDPGNLTFTMNFTREAYDIIKADFENDDNQNYELVLPDDEKTSFEFEGLVTELPLDLPPNDRISANVTIKISGQVTVESGSGPSVGA